MVIRRLYILARRIIYGYSVRVMRWRCAVAPRATVQADNSI